MTENVRAACWAAAILCVAYASFLAFLAVFGG
jgi:hypothetical protein